jgi:hypothetical protein
MSATRPKMMAPKAEASGRVEQRRLSGGQVPLFFQDRDHDADDEKVIGVGEEPHARDEHDLDLKAGDLARVELLQLVLLYRCRR